MAMHRDAWNELFKTPSGPTWAGWVAPPVAVSVVLGVVALSGGGDVPRSTPQVAAPTFAPPSFDQDVPAPTPAPPVLPVADPAPAPVAPEPVAQPVRAELIAHVTPAPAATPTSTSTPTPTTIAPPATQPSARKPVPTTVGSSEPTLSTASAKKHGDGQKVSHQAQKHQQQQGSEGPAKHRGRRGQRR